jgi:hypothetical protein
MLFFIMFMSVLFFNILNLFNQMLQNTQISQNCKQDYCKLLSSLVENTFSHNTDFFFIWIRVMVFNATFNNISGISWMSVILVEETGKNHRPVASE